MEITEIIGYFGALLIGIVLGLIGGGGSILTVPVLVYLFYINPVTATAYSLFVVGVSALVGGIQNMINGLVDYKTAIVFSIPAFIGVYIARKFIVPSIPEELFELGGFIVTKNVAIMAFFAVIMLLASFSMIMGRKKEVASNSKPTDNIPLIILEGAGIGIITGVVGAGGGFLIIPALVLFAGLPMKKAVATSLCIIAVKSLIGFLGDVENMEIDWKFLLGFTAISVIGIFIGTWLNKFVDGKKLKKGFGWFVLVMGVYILISEFT